MDSDHEITCIPNDEQKYISFSERRVKGKPPPVELALELPLELRFLDSAAFLSGSLESIAKSMTDLDFQYTREYFPTDAQFAIARRKGFYPYEWVDADASQKMTRTSLPPKEAFTSELYGGSIDGIPFESKVDDNSYADAQEAWKTLGCSTFLDYHMLYLKIDVLLLSDIFENFRKLTIRTYGLDPLHYFTTPGLSWDALLKKSQIELDLLSDGEMVNLIERGIYGGISMVRQTRSEGNGIRSHHVLGC